MRKTLKVLQDTVDIQTIELREYRIENAILKSKCDFLIQQSSSGILVAMNCTLQRLAETTTNLIQAIPSLRRP